MFIVSPFYFLEKIYTSILSCAPPFRQQKGAKSQGRKKPPFFGCFIHFPQSHIPFCQSLAKRKIRTFITLTELLKKGYEFL